MPTYEDGESLASVRTKINDGIQNSETALLRLDVIEPAVDDHEDRIQTLEGSVSGVAWGSITGTLSSQTDLQTALNGKQASGSYATGAQGALADSALQPGDTIPWVDISGKPSTFTPSTHSHVIADVTGLQTALDGKQVAGSYAAASHTHLAANITDFATAVAATAAVTANTAKVTNATHTGDVTGATALTIANDVVTNAKLANVATATFKGRTTAGTGDPEDLSVAQAKTLLNLTGTNSGDQTSIVGITGTKAQFDTAVTDGNIMYVGDAPTAHTHTSADITDFNSASRAQTEAELVAGTNVTITPSGSGATRQLTIAASASGGATNLSYTAATRVIASDTGTDATLPLVTSGDAGLAPASGGGTTNFLRADGTWAAPGGGGGATNLAWDASTSTITSDTGTDATLTLATNANPGLQRKPEASPDRFYVFEDYVGGSVPGFVQQVAGTGAGTTLTNTNVDTVGCGWIQFNLGTTTTGRAHQTTAPLLIFNSGLARYRSRVRMTALSDATNTYTFRTGFVDANSAESTDGAFFRYTHGTNSGKFECVTRANSVQTATDSGITATINTNYIFEVIVNAAGTEVQFYVDNVLVQTHTTNIPTGGGRETGCGIGAIRSAGTAAYTPFWCDYQLLDYERGAR